MLNLYEPWQIELANAICQPIELLNQLLINSQEDSQTNYQLNGFSCLVPHSFLSRMKKNDINDPLLRQVLPLKCENDDNEGFVNDPVGDSHSQVTDNLIHKYKNRLLIITSHQCAVHCRYCFRRHFPYQMGISIEKIVGQAVPYLSSHPEVNEVILSGGDPLSLTNFELGFILNSIAKVPSVKRLRMHTRFPIIIPSRINDGFIQTIDKLPLPLVMVFQCNHTNELNDDLLKNAFKRLKTKGVTLLNQSVLLKGVNDCPAKLINLSEALFAHQIQPYYLHMLDKVAGAAHFDVSEIEAKHLIDQMQQVLPGYLVPKLVREIAGKPYKTLL